MKPLKSFFQKIKSKMNNKKRWLILLLTSIFSITFVALGSSFYIPQNAKKSIEYGGGAEYVLNIDVGSQKDSKMIADEVAEQIYNRIDPLGIKGIEVRVEKGSNNNSRIRVLYPGIKTIEERKKIEKIITKKPKLTFTDVDGNPLFDKNGFFTKKHHDWKGGNAGKLQIVKSVTPIKSEKTKVVWQNKYEVQIGIKNDKVKEWEKATAYIAKKPKGQNQIVAWLNINEFAKIMSTKWKNIWNNANHNPVAAAYVAPTKKNLFKIPNKNPSKDDESNFLKNLNYNSNAKTKPTPQKKPKTLPSHLWENIIKADQYLISRASVAKALTGDDFVISGNFTLGQAKKLSNNINFGTANYSLGINTSRFINPSYGHGAFHSAMIAGIIVFILIAIFLIVNYGLLGILSTISISLYIFITLTLFTAMQGQYSPESVAALIIGVGMAVDANIITYERFKSEFYAGSSIQKSYKLSNKKSISTILDSNITTFIVAIILFYFGTRNIIGLSVTLILSILLTFIIIVGFTRFTTKILMNINIFENKKYLLGLKPNFDNKIQEKINKFNYIKNAKWFSLTSAIIFGVGLIVMSVMSLISWSIIGGFNLSQDFSGGTLISVYSDKSGGILNGSVVEKIHNFLINKGINSSEIKNILNSNGDVIGIKYSSVNIYSNFDSWKQEFDNQFSSYDLNYMQSLTSTFAAQQVLKYAMISIFIAICGIVLYTILRFKWTYSFPAVIALLHDALIVLSIFVIFRIEISPIFIAGLLAIMGYSINDTIVTFDRIRENMKDIKEINLTKEKIKEIANNSIKETLKRSTLTSFTTILSVIVLMCFGNATKLSFNIVMFVGLIAGTYSSIFIATYLWTKLEAIRVQKILKRSKNKYWENKEPEEQIFVGINDFKY